MSLLCLPVPHLRYHSFLALDRSALRFRRHPGCPDRVRADPPEVLWLWAYHTSYNPSYNTSRIYAGLSASIMGYLMQLVVCCTTIRI